MSEAICVDTNDSKRYIYRDATGNPAPAPIDKGVRYIPRCDTQLLKRIASNTAKMMVKRKAIQDLLDQIPPMAVQIQDQLVDPILVDPEISQIKSGIRDIEDTLTHFENSSTPVKAQALNQTLSTQSLDVNQALVDLVHKSNTHKTKAQHYLEHFDQLQQIAKDTVAYMKVLDDEKQTVENELIKLKQTHTALEDNYNHLQSQLNNQVQSKEDEILRIQGLNNQLIQEKSNVENERDALDQDKHTLEQEKVALQQQLNDQSNQFMALQQNITTLQEEITQKEKIISDHQATIDSLTLQLNDLTQQLQQSTQMVQQLQGQLKSAENQYHQNTSLITKYQQDIQTLKSQLQGLKQEYQKGVQSFQQEVAQGAQTLEANQARLLEEYSKLQAMVQAYRENITVLTGENHQLKNELASLGSQLSAAKQQELAQQNQLQAQAQRLATLEQTSQRILQERKVKEQQIQQLSQALSQAQQMTQQLTQELGSKEANIQQLNQLVQQTRQELLADQDVRRQRTQALGDKFREAQQQLQSLTRQIQSKTQELHTKDQLIQQLTQKYKQAQSEMARLEQVQFASPSFSSQPDVPYQSYTDFNPPPKKQQQPRISPTASPSVSPRSRSPSIPSVPPSRQIPPLQLPPIQVQPSPALASSPPVSPRLVQPLVETLSSTAIAPVIAQTAQLMPPRQAPSRPVSSIISSAGFIDPSNLSVKEKIKWFQQQAASRYSPYAERVQQLSNDIDHLEQENNDLLYAHLGHHLDHLPHDQCLPLIQQAFYSDADEPTPREISHLAFARLGDALRLQHQLSNELHGHAIALLVHFRSNGGFLHGILVYQHTGELEAVLLQTPLPLSKLPDNLRPQEDPYVVSFYNSAPSSRHATQERTLPTLRTPVNVPFALLQDE